MKDNFIHVCFVIDESGSMSGSESDVIGGFKKVVDEQKAVENGQCAISLYKFNGNVAEVYVGKDVNSVEYLKESEQTIVRSLNWITDDINNSNMIYYPMGCTAMFDGIGTAIDNIGKWLSNMPEEERPSKNLIVIMTDGEENASRKYSSSQIKEMIKHQEEKYNWSFIYMGTDITTTEYADSIGIKNQAYVTRSDHGNTYKSINTITTSYRMSDAATAMATMDSCLYSELSALNEDYSTKTGINIDKKSS